MTDKPINMTRPLDLTHEKRNVGPQRIQRPIYTDLLPTCNNACPAGENIQAWLAHAQAGRFKEAWLTLMGEATAEALGVDPSLVFVKTRRRLGADVQYLRASRAGVTRSSATASAPGPGEITVARPSSRPGSDSVTVMGTPRSSRVAPRACSAAP